jgi:hypothetical protein
MALVLLLAAGTIVFLSEWRHRQPHRLSGRVPLRDREVDPWSKIVQKGQVIVSEPFTSIGGYAIACDGRDFMYAPEVDQPTSKYQMENPQEIPLGL